MSNPTSPPRPLAAGINYWTTHNTIPAGPHHERPQPISQTKRKTSFFKNPRATLKRYVSEFSTKSVHVDNTDKSTQKRPTETPRSGLVRTQSGSFRYVPPFANDSRRPSPRRNQTIAQTEPSAVSPISTDDLCSDYSNGYISQLNISPTVSEPAVEQTSNPSSGSNRYSYVDGTFDFSMYDTAFDNKDDFEIKDAAAVPMTQTRAEITNISGPEIGTATTISYRKFSRTPVVREVRRVYPVIVTNNPRRHSMSTEICWATPPGTPTPPRRISPPLQLSVDTGCNPSTPVVPMTVLSSESQHLSALMESSFYR